jgi:hypothetical protein
MDRRVAVTYSVVNERIMFVMFPRILYASLSLPIIT